MVVIISLPEVYFHLLAPVSVGQGALLQRVPEQRQNHFALTSIFFPLGISGVSAPVFLTFPLVTSMILIYYVGSTGPISIVPAGLVGWIGTHGGIVLFGVIFRLFGVGLLRVILEFRRLSCWMVVIWHSSSVWEHRQDRPWARGLGRFPPMLLGKALICPADHSPASSNRIFLQLPMLPGSQVQVL